MSNKNNWPRLSFRIQSVQSDMNNLFNLFSSMVVHRKKFSSLFDEMNKYYLLLRGINFENRYLVQSEKHIFDKIQLKLKELNFHVSSLTETSYKGAILEKKVDFYRKYVFDFRCVFNADINSLRFLSFKLPFNENSILINNEDLEDCNEILKLLESEPKDPCFNEFIVQLKDHINKMLISQTKEIPKTMSILNIDSRLQDLDRYRVVSDDFEIQKMISSSRTSELFRAFHNIRGKSHNMIVAIRRYIISEVSESFLDSLSQELHIQSGIHLYTVLPFIGFCFDNTLSIINEYMAGGSLFSRLQDTSNPLDSTNLTIIALGVAHAMDYLHHKEICHQNFTSSSVLLDIDGYPRVYGFGTSLFYNNGIDFNSDYNNIAQWMAPELFDNNERNEKSNVYSFGILLWEMLTKTTPFAGMSTSDIINNVVKNDNRPLIPGICSSELKTLIKKCWSRNPKDRPTFQNIIVEFSTGIVSFNGADMLKVQAYYSVITEDDDTKSSSIDFKNPNDSKIVEEQLNDTKFIESQLNGLTRDGSDKAALFNTLTYLRHSKAQWANILIKKNYIPAIISILEEDIKPNILSKAIEFIGVLFDIPELSSILIKNNITGALLNVYSKIGSTSMPCIIQCLHNALKKDISGISSKHLSKLSMFLLSNDLSICDLTIDLLIKIINEQRFDSEKSIVSLMPSLRIVLIPDTKPEYLQKCLSLVELIIEFEHPYDSFISNEGILQILSLLTMQHEQIRNITLGLLIKMQSSFSKEPKLFNMMQKYFCQLFKILKMDQFKEFLGLFLLSVQNITSKVEFFDNKNIIDSINEIFLNKDKDQITLLLKSLYILIGKEENIPSLLGLINGLISLIRFDYSIVSKHVIYCIIIICALNQNAINLLIGDDLSEFLNKAYTIKDMIDPILRLIGVLSYSICGSCFIHECGIVKFIVNKIKDKNYEDIKLFIMAILSLSQSMPHANGLFESIPIVIENLYIEDDFSSVYTFLKFITLAKREAIEVTKYLIEILQKATESDDENIFRITGEIVKNILFQKDTRSLLDNNPQEIECIFLFLNKMNEKKIEFNYLDIFDYLTVMKNAKSCVSTQKIFLVYKELYAKKQLSEKYISQYIRISNRILSTNQSDNDSSSRSEA